MIRRKKSKSFFTDWARELDKMAEFYDEVDDFVDKQKFIINKLNGAAYGGGQYFVERFGKALADIAIKDLKVLCKYRKFLKFIELSPEPEPPPPTAPAASVSSTAVAVVQSAAVVDVAAQAEPPEGEEPSQEENASITQSD